MTVLVALPYPPSDNALRGVVRGKIIKSRVYRAWEASCRQFVFGPVETITGPYQVVYIAQRPDRRRRDVENLPKALGDMLQRLGIVADDCNCIKSTAQWAEGEPVGKGAMVMVEITPQ